MSTVELKTADLKDVALDFAMAEAEGIKYIVADDSERGKVVVIVNDGQRKPICAGDRYSKVETTFSWFGLVRETRELLLGWAYEPTLCWANIRKYRVSLTAPRTEGEEWTAHLDGVSMPGEDIGPAVCRAIVAAKLGEVVQVPIDLAGGA